jgi:hypothetical protein
MQKLTLRWEGFFSDLITWSWTKRLLHWIIISAGTMSECVFLIASIWMSINSSVHPFVLLIMSEAMTEHLSQLATAAYVALPEAILGLAFVTTLSHIRLIVYNRHDKAAWVWASMYGIPTIIFLLLSLITLGYSVADVNFLMPEPLVVTRAIAAFWFSFTSLLHTQVGIPQEADRLRRKDEECSAMQQHYETLLATLQQQLSQQSSHIDTLTLEIATLKSENSRLQSQSQRLPDLALQAYSNECLEWLKSGVKTVSIEDITRFTGHQKAKIKRAIERKQLALHPRNGLVTMASLIEWLKYNPPLMEERETEPIMALMGLGG